MYRMYTVCKEGGDNDFVSQQVLICAEKNTIGIGGWTGWNAQGCRELCRKCDPITLNSIYRHIYTHAQKEVCEG